MISGQAGSACSGGWQMMAWAEAMALVFPWGLGAAGLAMVTWSGLRYQKRIQRLERHRVDQERFAARLLDKQERECKRMAADLHDGLGQNLILIKNRTVLALHSGKKEDVEFQLHEISRVAAESIEEMRKISRNLRPYQLDRLGLTKAMRALVKQAAQTSPSSIDFHIAIEMVDEIFSKDVEINLYRILQEAITNVLKHSEASRVSVVVQRTALGCGMVIEDNGRGFDKESSGHAERRSQGMGLTTIRERARMIRGQLQVKSEKGQGVRLQIAVPRTHQNSVSWTEPLKS